MIQTIKKFLKTEPVVVLAVGSYVVAVAAELGFDILSQVEGAQNIIVGLLALVPILGAAYARQMVTPNGKVVERLDEYGVVVAGEGNDMVSEGGFVRVIGDDDEDLVNLS